MRSRVGLFMVLETEETWASLEAFTGDFLGGARNDLSNYQICIFDF